MQLHLADLQQLHNIYHKNQCHIQSLKISKLFVLISVNSESWETEIEPNNQLDALSLLVQITNL